MMNPEDQEFLESDHIILSRKSCDVLHQTVPDSSSDVVDLGESQFWKRNEVINDVTLSILTVAYGGTKYSGRKLYDASLILAKWLRNQIHKEDFTLTNKYIIELGCGSTGIPGMISIASGASHVHFCDIDSQALVELTNNLTTNLPILEKHRSNNVNLMINDSKSLFTISNTDWNHLLLSSHPTCDLPVLILASEVVYDAIDIELLVSCIHRLIAHEGSMLFCQSRYGRGRIQEFIQMMTSEPYNYQFTEFEDILELIEEEDADHKQSHQSHHQQNKEQQQEQQQQQQQETKEYIFGMFY